MNSDLSSDTWMRPEDNIRIHNTVQLLKQLTMNFQFVPVISLILWLLLH